MAQLVGILGRSVLADWTVLVAEGLTVLIVPLLSDPNMRGFSCSDESIRLPYKEDTIPTWALGVGFVIGGIALMILMEMLLAAPGPSGVLVRGRALPVRGVQLYSVLTTFLCGAGFSQITTDIAKYHVGALRPHFFEVCRPSVSCNLPTEGGGDPFRFYATGDYECYGDNQHRIKEARLSFPSGHASLSFYTAVYLIFYFQARIRDCSATRSSLACFLIRPLLQGLVVLAAWFTLVSRVMDHMHHWRDVTAGGLIGTVAALLIVHGMRPFTDVRPLKPNEESPLRHLRATSNGTDVERNSAS